MVEHVRNLAQIFDRTFFALTFPEIYISKIIFSRSYKMLGLVFA